MSRIIVEQVTKVYQSGGQQVAALAGIDLMVQEGEFVALMGASGSGKSTLLTVLGALNPPTQGRVSVDGIDIYQLSGERRADFRSTYLGFVFQQFQLIPYLTAVENVMLPLAISDKKGALQYQLAQEALVRVGLGNKLKRLPNQLSGGEQERVAIARAMVNQPPIILADEPTGSLDTKTGEEIMELFQELHQDGLTIVMVTHNRDNITYVDRAIHIKDGLIEGVEQVKPGQPAEGATGGEAVGLVIP